MAKYKIQFKASTRQDEEVEAFSVAHEGDWIKFNDGSARPVHVVRQDDVKRYDCTEPDPEPWVGIA